ncbi:trehalase [Monodelphis domestica]|uniref:Trehalase n=1 Tax=Monodelphis domestica TaxID=13616 RepID=F7D8S1_MONDO|nr:trehalase [Monodelphis domestica]
MQGRNGILQLVLLLGLELGLEGALPPPCDSQIYCSGELLRRVQMAKLYRDDKHFVDMPLNTTPDQVLKDFSTLLSSSGGYISRDLLKSFVMEHFNDPGQEMETWIPEDWRDSPKFLQNILDPKLRAWAKDLHNLWKKLGRKMKLEVGRQPDRYSLLYAAQPFIVPGGRFIEFYYWDSFWVIQGLLLSEMPQTVKGMLQNFLDIVERYGHIPNGGRVYYLQRSQPPLLTLMMDRYLAYTNDTDFLRASLGTLHRELEFWRHNRSVNISHKGASYTLNRYHVPYGGPRPESYSKDQELAELLPEDARESLWAELKAGAESGWDFSSRWFVGSNYLLDIKTSQVVPVDLNAFLCQAEGLLAAFYATLGNTSMAQVYEDARARRKAAMEALLWNETLGAWFDFNLESRQQNHAFYPTNLSPLWAGCFSDPAVVIKNVKYLEDNKILTYKHGIPTSLQISGQQWDFPNAWAPLQDLVVKGLAESNSRQAQEMAFQLAQNWIRTNFAVYQKNKVMYEKYDINMDSGEPGGGGEYEVQEGFGWTNGVALKFLNQYGDRLTSGSGSTMFGTSCLLLALLLLGLLC